MSFCFVLSAKYRCRTRPGPRTAGRRFCAVQAFCRRQNLGAGAIHLPRAFQIPQVSKKRSTCKAGASFFGKSLQSRYFKFSIGFLHLAQRPFWAAPLLRRSSVLPKAKPRRRANSLRPSNLKNPRYPKKKHLLCRCFFFEKSLQSEYFQILCKRTELHPPGLLAGGASAPYKRFHRR